MDRFLPSSNDPDERWFRVGNVDVTTTVLVTGLAAISMLLWAISVELLEPFVLFADEVRGGQVWRLVTWPIANEPSLWTVLSLAIFYLFGREIERRLGRIRFLWFLLAVTFVPGLVATALDLNAAGLRSINMSVFLVFVLMYPTARSFFDIPLWVFGVVFLGIEVLQLVGLRAWDELVVLSATGVTAIVMARGFGLLEIGFLPRFGGRGVRARPARRPRRRRPPAEVIPMRPAQPTPEDLLRQAEVDILLDKISEHGLDSLTPEERRRLDEHSRRLRGER